CLVEVEACDHICQQESLDLVANRTRQEPCALVCGTDCIGLVEHQRLARIEPRHRHGEGETEQQRKQSQYRRLQSTYVCSSFFVTVGALAAPDTIASLEGYEKTGECCGEQREFFNSPQHFGSSA